LAGTAVGLAGTRIASGQLSGLRSATPRDLQNLVGDFEKADVLIDGKTIAQIAPNIAAGDAEVVDCSGTIVMPGFITTHHHQYQYETLGRSIIADGRLNGVWPEETYGSVVQNIWTSGRITEPGTAPGTPGKIIWDLGRVPYDPEDCYISEVVACLSEISEGIACGTDTSQANHTPAHTDAMINGLMDSGRRMVFDYGMERRPVAPPGRAGARPGARPHQRPGEGRQASTVQQQFQQSLPVQQSLPAEFPGKLLLQRAEHHDPGICVETLT
jgi:cytosine/adenosine deaminase-related metal-dependent hydrolase